MSRFLGELTRISNLTCYKGACKPIFFRDYVLHGDRASLEPTRQAYPADNVPWLKGLWEQLGDQASVRRKSNAPSKGPSYWTRRWI